MGRIALFTWLPLIITILPQIALNCLRYFFTAQFDFQVFVPWMGHIQKTTQKRHKGVEPACLEEASLREAEKKKKGHKVTDPLLSPLQLGCISNCSITKIHLIQRLWRKLLCYWKSVRASEKLPVILSREWHVHSWQSLASWGPICVKALLMVLCSVDDHIDCNESIQLQTMFSNLGYGKIITMTCTPHMNALLPLVMSCPPHTP